MEEVDRMWRLIFTTGTIKHSKKDGTNRMNQLFSHQGNAPQSFNIAEDDPWMIENGL
jgi:hypothetical protein